MQNLCTSLTIAPNSHVISRKFSPNHSGQHFNQTKSQMSRGCQAFFTQSRPPGISGFNPQSAIFSTSPPLWKKKNKKLVQHFTWIYCCDLYGWIPIFPHQKTRLESISSTSGHVFFQSFAGVIILSGNTTTVCWVVKFEKTTDYHTDWHLETSQKRNQLKDESKRFLKQIGIWNWTIKRKLNLSIGISHVCVSLYFTILLSKTHLDISYPSALQFWHVWIYISLESAKCK